MDKYLTRTKKSEDCHKYKFLLTPLNTLQKGVIIFLFLCPFLPFFLPVSAARFEF